MVPNFKALLLAASLATASAQAPKPLTQQVQDIVSQVSADHIAEIQQKLETFQTRNIYSSTEDPVHGVGAAREWIAAQFRGYSPKLEVSFDKHRLAKQRGAFRNVEIWNVVAVLKGTTEPEQQVLITAHYDTISRVYKPGASGEREVDVEATAATPIAPGVTDDGSGTAAVLELARVMSQYQFRKTIVFIAFAAEEYGLFGSGLYAADAATRHDHIETIFNNDIIGSNVTGNGETSNRYINVYSEDPNDSPSREAARYLKSIAERYQPGFEINLVFRHDRFGRGGDHSPFNAAGFSAVRITTPMENFSDQHTANDVFAHTAPTYTALVTKANAAAAATLALAPRMPEIRTPPPLEGRSFASPLKRGAGYDAVMVWNNDHPEPDLAGYSVVLRKTTSPCWEREIFVGNVTTFTLPNVNIDELTLGVKALDKEGNESLVNVFVTPHHQQRKIETY